MSDFIPIKIENETSYIKDDISGAFINVDKGLLAERMNRQKLRDTIKTLQNDVSILKQEIYSIKKIIKMD